jgi:hypothetical protein
MPPSEIRETLAHATRIAVEIVRGNPVDNRWFWCKAPQEGA